MKRVSLTAFARGGLLLLPLIWLALALPAGATAAAAPQITASWVTDVTPSSANLRAKIDPEGASTSYRFEYLTEAAYNANLAAEPAGDGFEGASVATGGSLLPPGTEPVAVLRHLVGLASTTPYLYRAVAVNAAGTTVGPEHLLVTEGGSSASSLLDGRGWEMVSPVDKSGGAVGYPGKLFGGGDFQAAAAGAAVTYGSTSAFGEPAGGPPVSQYLARRSASGWTTANISVPLESGGYGDQPDGSPYRVFAEDLSRGLLLGGSRCAAAGTCPRTYSLWEAGALQPLPQAAGLAFAGASPDLLHVALTADAGLYRWSGGPLDLVSAGAAALAAPIGAVSADGSRVYFTLGGNLYLRDGQATVQVDADQGGGGQFQAASADGAVAFYTVGSTLYRYDVAGGSSQQVAAAVVGVLGVSASGGDVYYQDATALQHWHQGTVTAVASGADVAAPSDYPPAVATARVTADGAHLAFLSAAAIPPFDNLDATTETPDTQVYVYGPPPGGGAPRLLCASCNPAGERPTGSASIPGAEINGTTAAYRPRALSPGGHRLFFETPDSLVIGDSNGRRDVYEWEATGAGGCTRAPGCVALVSGGRAGGGSFVDASLDGSDAYFVTEESLVEADPGSVDLYDARIGGGFPPPALPIVCNGDSCQPLPAAPDDPTPATSAATSGNPAPRYFKPAKKHRRRGKHHRRRHHNRPAVPRRGG